MWRVAASPSTSALSRRGQTNPKPGLQYVFRHRVVLPTSPLGCEDHGTGRIFGWVILGDGWRLTKNKNDLAELKDEIGGERR
jgi:hypothetical protein